MVSEKEVILSYLLFFIVSSCLIISMMLFRCLSMSASGSLLFSMLNEAKLISRVVRTSSCCFAIPFNSMLLFTFSPIFSTLMIIFPFVPICNISMFFMEIKLIYLS